MLRLLGQTPRPVVLIGDRLGFTFNEVLMNPINFALRRPITIVVALLSLVLTSLVAIRPKVVDQWLSSVGIDLP